MSESQIDGLKVPEEIKKEISQIVNLIEEKARAKKTEVKLQVVGGAIKKEWPRKDIDLSIELLDYRGKGNKELEIARDELKFIEQLIGEAIKNTPLRISAVNQPALDHEIEDNNVLVHNGSITINGNASGIPIEIVRVSKHHV